jgi:hypothetical protein
MKSPSNGFEEHQLVLIDFQRVETGYLAPCPSGVIPILEVFRCKNQSCQEHPTAALHGPQERLIPRLLLGKVEIRNMRLDLDQIIESHLQSAVAGARPTECLLDKCAKRQDSFAPSSSIAAMRDRGQRPDSLDNLRSGIFWERRK